MNTCFGQKAEGGKKSKEKKKEFKSSYNNSRTFPFVREGMGPSYEAD